MKKIEGDALFAFCLREFRLFARSWPSQRDLKRLAIEFSADGYPICGREDMLARLFDISLLPESCRSGRESADLFLTCYQRAPDFTLALILRIRERFSKTSPHQRRMLFWGGRETPKQVRRSLPKAVTLAAVQKERQRIWAIAKVQSEDLKKARTQLDKTHQKQLKRVLAKWQPSGQKKAKFVRRKKV